MIQPGADPFTKINARFITATIEIAQHPVAGVALVGATIMSSLLSSCKSTAERHDLAEQFVNTDLQGDQLRSVTAATAAVHGLYSVRTGPDLQRSVAFAYELVRNGIISTCVEHSYGEQGSQRPEIGILTPGYQYDFAELAKDSDELLDLFVNFSSATKVVIAPDSPADAAKDMYRAQILAISARYRHDRESPARMDEMDTARSSLSSELLTPMHDAVRAEIVDRHSANLFVSNTLRHAPSHELIHQHFGN